MQTHPLFKTTAFGLVVSLSLWTFGCSATTYVQTDDLRGKESGPVRIIAPGGSEYRLDSWKWQDSSVVAIEGKVLFAGARPGVFGKKFVGFTGVIPADSLKQRFYEEADVTGAVVGDVFIGLGVLAVVALIYAASGGLKIAGHL
jgi:hypothetical protein